MRIRQHRETTRVSFGHEVGDHMRFSKKWGIRAGLWRLAMAAVLAMLALLLSGCASTGGGLADTAAGTRIPSAGECQQVAAVPRPATALRVELLIDNTTSQTRQGLPPAVAEQLQAAQRSGAVLTILAVNGADAAPRLVRTIALDPRAGHDSPEAEEARRIALECVPGWAYGPDAVPTAGGSDVAAALAAAARQRPQKLLVVSDAAATAGAVNLNVLGYDANPKGVATAARKAKVLPSLAGTEVVWTTLGETVQPLPEPARSGLQELWQALLRAAGAPRIIFDTRTAEATAPAAASTRPRDPIPVPHADQLNMPHHQGSCFRFPAAMLFTPDSSRLAADAASQLAPVAQQLTQQPGWKATVAGHTARYGTPAGRQRLSQARADAVAGVLRGLGISSQRLGTVGYGATHPLKPEWDHGRHDPVAAAANRRVEIVLHPAGSNPPAVCPTG